MLGSCEYIRYPILLMQRSFCSKKGPQIRYTMKELLNLAEAYSDDESAGNISNSSVLNGSNLVRVHFNSIAWFKIHFVSLVDFWT